MQLVPLTTKVVKSHHANGELYSIQHYVIKLSATCGSSVVLQFPSTEFELTTVVVIGTVYTGSSKSNYHTITTTMTLTPILSFGNYKYGISDTIYINE
jgi:hypothetical protein